MEKRRIGRSDISIAPLMFGGNVFGWTVERPTAYRLLDLFVDNGFDAIDTADFYMPTPMSREGVGVSERIIGEWLAQGGGRRDKIMLATKLGLEMREGGKGLSATYMVEAVENSLRRLRTDRIDLYQAHRDDPDTPQEETLRAFDQLVRDGKVRVIGASNFSPERLSSALALSADKGLARYDCLQPHYNLADRAEFEATLSRLCLDQQVAVIPYFSLASGFLTGKYRSLTDIGSGARASAVREYLNARGLRILAALDAVAAAHDATPAQVALAWLMHQPAVTAPIASATSVAQLEQIMGAVRLSLTVEQLGQLDAASVAE